MLLLLSRSRNGRIILWYESENDFQDYRRIVALQLTAKIPRMYAVSNTHKEIPLYWRSMHSVLPFSVTAHRPWFPRISRPNTIIELNQRSETQVILVFLLTVYRPNAIMVTYRSVGLWLADSLVKNGHRRNKGAKCALVQVARFFALAHALLGVPN